jgi:hypothetical protein
MTEDNANLDRIEEILRLKRQIKDMENFLKDSPNYGYGSFALTAWEHFINLYPEYED